MYIHFNTRLIVKIEQLLVLSDGKLNAAIVIFPHLKTVIVTINRLYLYKTKYALMFNDKQKGNY